MEYDATNLKFDLLKPDKYKVFFNIEKKENALKIYDYFIQHRRIFKD